MKSKKNQINATEKKINSFRTLPVGWHYGSGIAPLAKVLDLAIQLNQFAGLMGFEATDAFPGIDGEVMLTVYDGDIYLEFSIEVDGSINYVHEQGDEEVDSDDKISLYQAINHILKIGFSKWRSSVLSTRNNMIQRRKDSRDMRLSRAKPTKSQFSRRNAPFKPAGVNVRTYEVSTRQLREIRQCSGKSHQPFSVDKVAILSK
ncbi:MAG: hypothetical protein DCF20_15465 [Pseudanabaena sp.]|nr:MAG: hypothetical protein DCF20_15465 [Pseudanabaena sp.]